MPCRTLFFKLSSSDNSLHSTRPQAEGMRSSRVQLSIGKYGPQWQDMNDAWGRGLSENGIQSPNKHHYIDITASIAVNNDRISLDSGAVQGPRQPSALLHGWYPFMLKHLVVRTVNTFIKGYDDGSLKLLPRTYEFYARWLGDISWDWRLFMPTMTLTYSS